MRKINYLILLIFFSIFISAIEPPFVQATNETSMYKDLGTLGQNPLSTSNLDSNFDAIKVDQFSSNSYKMTDHQIETSSSIKFPDGYPLIEEFNAPKIFTSTDPDVYIADGKVNWTIYRDEGEQHVYRSIPSFSRDVRLIVTGQIDSATNNCYIKVGIGNGLDSGIEVNYGVTGGGCATNGYLIDASEVSLDHSFVDCIFVGDRLWLNSGTQYTATLTIQEDSVDLSVPSVGSISGTPVFTSTNETLFIGDTGDGDLSSYSGVIESVVIEPITFCDSVSEIPPEECESLIALYTSTDGHNWVDKTGWLETYTPCSSPWYGVICSEGHVSHLNLVNNQLSGPIPPEIGNLSGLRYLYLYGNQLSGNIPLQIGNLNNLQYFYLHSNQLDGSIPPELGNLSSLQYLSLASNQLSGSIPPKIGNLPNLNYLSISDNQLSGSIPSELGNLSNLQYLYLNNNQINGDIPPELGNLTNLISLYLYNNQLSGSIPPDLGNLSELQDLLLYYNQLTGEIPSDLGGLYNLLNLYLYGNQLSGSIPPELSSLTKLLNLSLSSNQLEGSIPPVLGNLPALQYLYLYNNNLSGIIPLELGDLSNLKYLYLSNNQLSGGIPSELGSLTKLTHLQLRNNALEGEIPITFAQLANLDAAVTDFGYNMLAATDQTVAAFLNSKDPDWSISQTVPPANVQVAGVKSDSVEISWQPIGYFWDGGYYEVAYATNSDGPYTVRGVTSDKNASRYVVIGLSPETNYYFTVRTYTAAHDDQQNELLSVYSPDVSSTTDPTSSLLFDITSVLPFQGRSDLPVEINIYGTGFQSGAIASLQIAQSTTSLDNELRVNGLLSVTEEGLKTTFIGAGHLRVIVPAGLALGGYDLIVRNPDGVHEVLPASYTVLEPEADDLFAYEFELWTNPPALREGENAQVGLTVHRYGGTTTLSNVKVRFYLGDPEVGGTMLGDGLISELNPNSAASTSGVSWSSPTEGGYTIYALIDPDGDVLETLEGNNRVISPISVMGSMEDTTPPTVDVFEINNGESGTTSRDVTLSVSASDQTFSGSGTGVGLVYIIEYEYNEGAVSWVPVQASDWLIYTSSPFNIEWTLMPSAGVKYLQIWAADAAGNISTTSRGALINYHPAAEDILAGASRYYIYPLGVGETFSALLTPAMGDPDLYVWSPSGESSWHSISGSGVADEVTFVTPQAGTYVVQVYGYTDATYFLNDGVSGAATTDLSPVRINGVLAKVPLSEPGLAPDQIPVTSIPYAVPPAPVDEFPILFPGKFRVYLPLAHR